TIFGPLFRPGPHVPVSRERWELSDGDFVDVDRMAGPGDAPLLVALHGLEGSSSAHYVRGLLAQARMRGWRALALNFRGCSGDMNRLVRSYHSGETGDLSELVRRAQDEPFIPARCVPRTTTRSVEVELSARGGHLGFVEGPIWKPGFYAERRAIAFLEEYVESRPS